MHCLKGKCWSCDTMLLENSCITINLTVKCRSSIHSLANCMESPHAMNVVLPKFTQWQTFRHTSSCFHKSSIHCVNLFPMLLFLEQRDIFIDLLWAKKTYAKVFKFNLRKWWMMQPPSVLLGCVYKKGFVMNTRAHAHSWQCRPRDFSLD